VYAIRSVQRKKSNGTHEVLNYAGYGVTCPSDILEDFISDWIQGMLATIPFRLLYLTVCCMERYKLKSDKTNFACLSFRMVTLFLSLRKQLGKTGMCERAWTAENTRISLKREEGAREWRKLHSEKVHNVYASLSSAGYVAWMWEMVNAYVVVVWKPYWRYPVAEGRKILGRILSMRGRELEFSGSEWTRFRHTHDNRGRKSPTHNKGSEPSSGVFLRSYHTLLKHPAPVVGGNRV
jgi:hypothetical protein